MKINEIIKSENIQTVEAELLDKDSKFENDKKQKFFYFKLNPLSKFKRILLHFIFLISFIFIVGGTLLSLTVIGAIIGIPLILIGIAILLFSIKLLFKKRFLT